MEENIFLVFPCGIIVITIYSVKRGKFLSGRGRKIQTQLYIQANYDIYTPGTVGKTVRR